MCVLLMYVRIFASVQSNNCSTVVWQNLLFTYVLKDLASFQSINCSAVVSAQMCVLLMYVRIFASVQSINCSTVVWQNLLFTYVRKDLASFQSINCSAVVSAKMCILLMYVMIFARVQSIMCSTVVWQNILFTYVRKDLASFQSVNCSAMVSAQMCVLLMYVRIFASVHVQLWYGKIYFLLMYVALYMQSTTHTWARGGPPLNWAPFGPLRSPSVPLGPSRSHPVPLGPPRSPPRDCQRQSFMWSALLFFVTFWGLGRGRMLSLRQPYANLTPDTISLGGWKSLCTQGFGKLSIK